MFNLSKYSVIEKTQINLILLGESGVGIKKYLINLSLPKYKEMKIYF